MWNDDVMVSKVNSLGGHAEMFKTDGPGHDCWEIAYGETDLFPWLQQQRRHSTASTPASGRPSSMAPAPTAPTAVIAHPTASPVVQANTGAAVSAAN